jgi:hypothetical protein
MTRATARSCVFSDTRITGALWSCAATEAGTLLTYCHRSPRRCRNRSSGKPFATSALRVSHFDAEMCHELWTGSKPNEQPLKDFQAKSETKKTTKSREFGAGEGNRTLVVSLGSFCSTIELHPRPALFAAKAVKRQDGRGQAADWHPRSATATPRPLHRGVGRGRRLLWVTVTGPANAPPILARQATCKHS